MLGFFTTILLKFSLLFSCIFKNIVCAALKKQLHFNMELTGNATAIALDVSCLSVHL